MSNDHPDQIPEDQLPPQEHPPFARFPEVLACVAIMGILVALLLPAVQSTRCGGAAPRSAHDEMQRRLELIQQAEAHALSAEQEAAAR